MARWLKISLKILGGLLGLLLAVIIGLTLYVTFNKAKVLSLVNTELRKNMNGTVVIGDMKPQFFKGFPNISLGLVNVLIRDQQYNRHRHTLLDAKNFDVSIDAAAVLHGTVRINHIAISNAAIDLFTDSAGYSNTSVFKKGPTKQASTEGSSSAELKAFSLHNVGFKVTNQQAMKLFDYVVNDLSGKMDYPDSGWHADFHLDVIAKSMAFKTDKGSFIRNKELQGDMTAGFNDQSGRIVVHSDELAIGDDPFTLHAVFETGKKATFNFHLTCKELLWRNASALLTENIQVKLNQFNMSRPLAVDATISGSFTGGDPFLFVKAEVKDNKVTTPGGIIDDCSFQGIFTNNDVNGKGLTDENSVIKLVGMKGSFDHIPLSIDTGRIINLTKPIATGNFKANFPVAKLNYLLGNKVAKFSDGQAVIDLNYKADIVDYQINKPIVRGSIKFSNATFNYLPANLLLKNTSLLLNFVGNDLVLDHIRVQSGRSIVNMQGRVNNFLNLYYDAPEKILLTWRISSPQLYLGEFLGFLSGGTDQPVQPKRSNSGNVIDQLSTVLQKGRAEMHLAVAKVHYNKFLATDARADLLTSQNGVIIKNVGVNHAGGALKLEGSLIKGRIANRLTLNTTVSNVNVREFFEAFDNFGMTDFTYQNLRGTLSATTRITANMNNKAAIIPRSIDGTVNVALRNAALINFKPLQGVGKYAFPFRDLKNITLPKLDARFDIKGDQITISPMQISSSVLNIDLAGVYGLSKGTNIAMDIPLRNPKGDSTITDQDALKKKRYKGIVLHLLAKADETGKIKIGFNKDRKEKNGTNSPAGKAEKEQTN